LKYFVVAYFDYVAYRHVGYFACKVVYLSVAEILKYLAARRVDYVAYRQSVYSVGNTRYRNLVVGCVVRNLVHKRARVLGFRSEQFYQLNLVDFRLYLVVVVQLADFQRTQRAYYRVVRIARYIRNSDFVDYVRYVRFAVRIFRLVAFRIPNVLLGVHKVSERQIEYARQISRYCGCGNDFA